MNSFPVKIRAQKIFTTSTSGSSGMDNNFLNNLKYLDKSKKEKFVSQIFSNVADNYDLMNDLMSFGLHRSWKKKMVSLIKVNEKSIVLDLASGSGDIAKLIKKKSNCECIIYDANVQMLRKAKKNWKRYFYFWKG